jgi:tetratricopeptide (TPR) repeat protein
MPFTADISGDIPFTAYNGDEPFIFISYSHTDKNLVFPEIRSWHDEGYRIWYDQGIKASEEWMREIVKSINKSAFFIVFISPSILDSIYVKREISWAIKRRKPFLAVFLTETKLPEELEFEISIYQHLFKYRLPEISYRKEMLNLLPINTRVPKLQQPASSLPNTPSNRVIDDLNLKSIKQTNFDTGESDGMRARILSLLDQVADIAPGSENETFTSLDITLLTEGDINALNQVAAEILQLTTAELKRTGDPTTYFRLGRVLQKLGSHEQAKAMYKACLAIQPDHPGALCNLLIALDATGEKLIANNLIRKASDACQKATNNNPSDARLWLFHGIVLTRAQDLKGAAEAFKKVIILIPTHIDAWLNLINCLLGIKDISGAIESCNKAIELIPENADLWFKLGSILDNSGNFEGALNAYRKTLTINSGFTEAERRILIITEAKENPFSGKKDLVDNEVDRCIVCKTQLEGDVYICPECKSAKYHLACAEVISSNGEPCWVCKKPISIFSSNNHEIESLMINVEEMHTGNRLKLAVRAHHTVRRIIDVILTSNHIHGQ